MTLAEFYAAHGLPGAIILPRQAVGIAAAGRQGGAEARADAAPTISVRTPAQGGGPDTKH